MLIPYLKWIFFDMVQFVCSATKYLGIKLVLNHCFQCWCRDWVNSHAARGTSKYTLMAAFITPNSGETPVHVVIPRRYLLPPPIQSLTDIAANTMARSHDQGSFRLFMDVSSVIINIVTIITLHQCCTPQKRGQQHSFSSRRNFETAEPSIWWPPGPGLQRKKSPGNAGQDFLGWALNVAIVAVVEHWLLKGTPHLTCH